MTRVATSWPAVLAGLLALSVAPAQQSAARFDAALVVATHQQRIERTLDLDGDGDQDAVGWWWQSSYRSWANVQGWINDGSGRLVPQAWSVSQLNRSTGAIPHETAAGDLDGDGRDDFAIAIGYHVTIYRSNGALAPTAWQALTLTSDEPIHSVAIADFDQDGRRDVLVASHSLRFLLNRGVLAPFEVRGPFPVGLPTSDLAVGDVDGDGHADLVIRQDPAVRLLPVLGGTPGRATMLTHAVERPVATTVGDIDGDGDLDVVVFGMLGRYQVLRRSGPASFVVEPTAPGGPATDLRDVDGDGDLDGVCCGGGGGGAIDNDQEARFEIALNDGGGGFRPAFAIGGLGAEHLAGAVDLDGDGDVDLVAGRCVYFARGPLAAPVQPAGLPGSAPRFLLGGVVPGPIAVHDVDRDGDPDLAAGLDERLANAGDGTFAPHKPVAPAASGRGRLHGPGFPGDFDGDGDVDLLVGEYAGDAFVRMRLLANRGGGDYVDAGAAGDDGVDFNLDRVERYDARRCVVADADGDGDLDLITLRIEGPRSWPDEYDAESRVWWNDGTGRFAAGPGFAEEVVRAVVDLDGDGAPELVTITDPWWVVGTRRNLGGGAFGAQVALPGGNPVLHPFNPVLAADFDRDGDQDLAAFHGSLGWLGVWVNDGAGGLLRTLALPPDSLVWWLEDKRMFATDVDGDGWLDLVAGPAEDARGTMVVLRRRPGPLTGTSAWDPPVVQVFTAAAAADVDGDGDADMIGAVVVDNTTAGAPSAGPRLQYGDGSGGAGGVVPKLGAVGPFAVGSLARIVASGARAGSNGVLAVGLARGEHPGVPTPDATTWLDLGTPGTVLVPIVFAGPPGDAGGGLAEVPIHVAPALDGRSFFHQAFVFDAQSRYGVCATNGLELRYGR